jgi:cytochrome c5
MSTVLLRIYILILVSMLSGCYYDNEETLYPGSANCNVPVTSTFSENVQPLLNNRCNSCHGGSSPSAGINLTSYTEVMKYVNNGSLMGSVNHTSGFSAMPKNSGKMSSCEIGTIQSWIDSGALNN